MRVNEIFVSLSGEVDGFGNQGGLATFVRLQGCNLNCNWCFGIKPGRRVPKVITSRGANKRLPDIRTGDYLLTFNSSGGLVETLVTVVYSREVDIWYRLKIITGIDRNERPGGRYYYVTGEHPLFTNRGLIRVENLKVGDQILHSTFQDKISFGKRGDRNPMKDPNVVARNVAATDYVDVGRKVSETVQAKMWAGKYQPAWNAMSKEVRLRAREKISTSQMGKHNSNYKEQGWNARALARECASGSLTICKLCKQYRALEVHHRDGDDDNDKPGNLVTICHSCHSKIHCRGYNFWPAQRSDGKVLSAANGFEVKEIKLVDRFKKPFSLRPLPLKVYNLACTPFNSYLLDYMWVHNCDTPKALLQGGGEELTVKEVVTQCQTQHIIITGGEPLLQFNELIQLVELLFTNTRKVTIETNGSRNLLPWVARDMHYVVDYKLASSGMAPYMKPGFFATLRDTDVIKFVMKDLCDYWQACKLIEEHTNWVAKKVFSPVAEHKNWPVILAQKIIEDRLEGVTLSLQYHKLLQIN